MPIPIPDSHRDLLEKPIVVTRVTITPQNKPHAVAVWQQFDGARFNIWFDRYVPGRGWERPGPLEADAGDAGYPRVALDGAGRALAVWHQSDGVRLRIMASWLE